MADEKEEKSPIEEMLEGLDISENLKKVIKDLKGINKEKVQRGLRIGEGAITISSVQGIFPTKDGVEVLLIGSKILVKDIEFDDMYELIYG